MVACFEGKVIAAIGEFHYNYGFLTDLARLMNVGNRHDAFITICYLNNILCFLSIFKWHVFCFLSSGKIPLGEGMEPYSRRLMKTSADKYRPEFFGLHEMNSPQMYMKTMRLWTYSYVELRQYALSYEEH